MEYYINKFVKGEEITPRRHAVIIAYQHLDPPLPFSIIGAKTGVAKTTCHNIYKHALNNAKKKCEAEGNSCPTILSESSAAQHAEDDTTQAAEPNILLIPTGVTQREVEDEPEEQELGLSEPGMESGMWQGSFQEGAVASPESFSLLDLIAADVLNPNA